MLLLLETVLSTCETQYRGPSTKALQCSNFIFHFEGPMLERDSWSAGQSQDLRKSGRRSPLV